MKRFITAVADRLVSRLNFLPLLTERQLILTGYAMGFIDCIIVIAIVMIVRSVAK